jgi:hypothetical protein
MRLIRDRTFGRLLGAVLFAGLAFAPSLRAGKPGQSMPVLVIVAHPHGFDQSALTIPTGQMLIIVTNQTRLNTIRLLLDPDSGPRAKDVDVPRENRAWREYLSLDPGHYVLTEASHPSWRCEITVTAK